MNNSRRFFLFVILSPVFFILTLWISVFPHEYAHAITAWLYGYKLSPFDISYGDFNWRNVLFVDGIDEHVNYFLIYLFGDRQAMGMIAFSGPLIATVLLYLVSLFLLNVNAIKKHPYLFYFVCWVNVANLSELISYAILRSISKHGDMGHIEFAWGVSPWLIFVVGGILLTIATWYFFSHTIVELYLRSRLSSTASKCFFLILFAVLLFGYPGARVLIENNGVFSMSLSIVFCILTPVIVIICWPRRGWVRAREGEYSAVASSRF